jgi:hypothetical protein
METEKTKTRLKKKIKESIGLLKSKKSALKEDQKKLEKKVKNISDKKGKKKKTDQLKAELKKLVKKEKQIKEKLKSKNSKLTDLNNPQKKSAKQESTKKTIKKKNSLKTPTVVNETTMDLIQPIKENALNIENTSMTQSAKNAIIAIRQMSDIKSLEEFIFDENRVTVQKAAQSRKNALLKNSEN